MRMGAEIEISHATMYSTEENSENLDKTSSSNSTKRPKPKPKQKQARSSSSSTPIKRKKRKSQMKKLHVNLRRRRNDFVKSGLRIFFGLSGKENSCSALCAFKQQNQVKKYRPTNY